MSSLRLIVNARIATGDPRRPWVDAAVLDGTTVRTTGASAALRKQYGTTLRVIDAKGAVIDLTAPSALQRLADLSAATD